MGEHIRTNPPNSGAMRIPSDMLILTYPIVCPMYRFPTVSTSKAVPTVQTIAALMPCNTLPRTSSQIVCARQSMSVAPASARSPINRGKRLEFELSAYQPATGLATNSAPPYTASKTDTHRCTSECGTPARAPIANGMTGTITA